MKMENKNQFTAIHRILHWSVALLMSILFITGFLRMYWMSKKTIIDTVETEMQSHNISLEKGQIIPIVKSIQKPMWEWHEYAAYIMFLAFLVRIIYMLVKGIKFPDPLKKSQSVKERMQGFIYVIFYLSNIFFGKIFHIHGYLIFNVNSQVSSQYPSLLFGKV